MVNKRNPKRCKLCWLCLIRQLAYFISLLERNNMQHNNFSLNNIMIDFNIDQKKFQLVLDLGSFVDYESNDIFHDDTFKPGYDLNQILNELLEKYYYIIPQSIYDTFSPLVEKSATKKSNNLTTGEEIFINTYRLMDI